MGGSEIEFCERQASEEMDVEVGSKHGDGGSVGGRWGLGGGRMGGRSVEQGHGEVRRLCPPPVLGGAEDVDRVAGH